MQVRTTTDRDLKARRDRSRGAGRATDSPGGAGSLESTKESSPFQTILDEVLPAHHEPSRDLHRLWSDLPETERRLIEDPSAENLREYREIVKAIANEVLEKNMKVAKLKRKNRQGEVVELNVLEVIDDRLHKMMLALQSPQNTAFQILRNLDEIRGLLLDMRK